jgi:hypothetical protein
VGLFKIEREVKGLIVRLTRDGHGR